MHLSYVYFLIFSSVSVLHLALSKFCFNSVPVNFTLWSQSPSPLVFGSSLFQYLLTQM